jgi:hypothetical protein
VTLAPKQKRRAQAAHTAANNNYPSHLFAFPVTGEQDPNSQPYRRAAHTDERL